MGTRPVPKAMPALLLFVVSLLGVAVAVAIWQSVYWRRRGISGPHGWPLFGHMLSFALGRKSYGEVYARLYNDHSSLSYVGIYRLFNEPAILIRDQRLLREILAGSFSHFQDNELWVDVEQRDVIVGHNPFVARGARWRQLRSELVPLFTPHRLRQTLPHIIAACQRLDEHVKLLPRRFEAKQLATRYTLQVVASATFGVDAQCLSADQCAGPAGDDEWLSLLAPLFQPSAWSLLETIALLHAPRLGRLLGHRYMPVPLQRWLLGLVSQLLQTRSKSSAACDFVQFLLEARRRLQLPADSDSDSDCELAITGHCGTLLLEGYETSASLLAFALYELASNAEVQQRLQEELEAVAERHAGQLLADGALAELGYVEAVLYETLRLHPAMPALQKRCTQPFHLPPQEQHKGGGVTVPRDMIIVLPVLAIHCDPDLYEQPLCFRPERFLERSALGCRFLGFGEGPRMCPGMRFGLAQTKAALVTLLRHHSVHLADKQPVEHSTRTFLTASKRGIWLQLKER